VRRLRSQSPEKDDNLTSGERRALRLPRAPGPLELSRDVHDALVRLMVTEHALFGDPDAPPPELPTTPVLSLEAVDALEDHLRARVHDDALAVFAARSDSLTGFELRQVGELTETAWERGLSKARVVLGTSGGRLVCIPRRPDRGYALRVSFFDVEDQTEGDGCTLAEWLDRVLEGTVDDLEVDPDLMESIEREISLVRFRPGLAPTLAAAARTEPETPRRVRHPKFGEGRVVRRFPESDKLEIDFGPHGTRVLVAKYVEELDRVG
jgi:hypothetical protein